MSNRATFSEGFTEEERRSFLQTLFPGLIATVIDLFTDDWPEEIQAKNRSETYHNIASAEVEYSTSKELASKEYKPRASISASLSSASANSKARDLYLRRNERFVGSAVRRFEVLCS